MQVDQEDQKAQSGDTEEKKSEAEEMEVLFCFLIDEVVKTVYSRSDPATWCIVQFRK